MHIKSRRFCLVRRSIAAQIALSLLPCASVCGRTVYAQAQTQQQAAQLQANSRQSAEPQTETPSQSIVQTPAPADQGSNLGISPGDLLTVDVFNTPELSGKFRVGQNGAISLPQGGVVSVVGMSPVKAQQAIEDRLRNAQIMLDPHVTILVQEYASEGVIVLGEVKNPGTYTLLGEHSLYGALAAAGGATTNQGSTITVSHPGTPPREEIIPITSPNYSALQRSTRVNPGDTVFVSRANLFYVVGNVTHPGAYPLPSGEPVRVLQAIALSAGTERASKLSKASIIRQTPAGPVTIPVNLTSILKNQAPDPYLAASDILVVPSSTVQAVLDTVIPLATSATLSAVISALIIR